MSVDQRLGSGLARNAQSLEPDVEVLLDAAWAHRRRTLRTRWAGAAAGLLAACAALVLALTAGWLPETGPAAEPVSSGASVVDLQGRYVGEVAPLPSEPGTDGRWVLDFQPDGVLAVTAPPAYPGVVSGVLYSSEEGTVRTDLFGQDLCSGHPLGYYTASRTPEGLVLDVVDDPCPQRVAVLTRTRWQSNPAADD